MVFARIKKTQSLETAQLLSIKSLYSPPTSAPVATSGPSPTSAYLLLPENEGTSTPPETFKKTCTPQANQQLPLG